MEVNKKNISYVYITNIYVCKLDIKSVCVYLVFMNAKEIYKSLGARIRDLRKGLPQTQDQFAKRAGISRASLANIEAGRQQVLVHHLFTFAAILQLDSPAHLLPVENSRPRKASSVDSLPLSSKDLTKNQRQEILNLVDSVLINSGHNSLSGENE